MQIKVFTTSPRIQGAAPFNKMLAEVVASLLPCVELKVASVDFELNCIGTLGSCKRDVIDFVRSASCDLYSLEVS